MSDMARTIGIGIQSFEKIIENNYFYMDKTKFIKEWWESGDDVTLITRPRRFGKTLNMSMTEQFFSIKYAGRGELFEGLSIWESEKYRKLQGTYPVIALSFADIKETNFTDTKEKIYQILQNLYIQHDFLLTEGFLKEGEEIFFRKVTSDISEVTASLALKSLSSYLERYYGKKVIILLDEYDTPMQEAYVNGYWEELVSFTRSMFNSTFKTNPHLDRAIMTGITRVSRESVFSDLNNLEVVTATSEKYADSFGFTEKEVFAALDEFGMSDKKLEVKSWYDGFTFGNCTDIYNPWSILNYLDKGKLDTYWANSSSNSLVGKLLRESGTDIKQDFEALISGQSIIAQIDEQIVYGELDGSAEGIFSLLLASGYLKVLRYGEYNNEYVDELDYELCLTNREVRKMFR
ncbi:MAG: AAA family ATPase, partial [Lachnospiraceae bacterium]|nr:AAA family ATPase [Lachnospiraceae bacterium]